MAPLLLGICVLTLIPVIATFALSFTEWNFIAGIEQLQWVGLENFQQLAQDTVFLKSLANNAIFMLTTPICMIISLLLAIIINKYVYMKDYFKVVYFLPYVSSVVAVAVVWQVLFHPSAGPINQFLMALGIDNPPKWIADPQFALVSVMSIHVWISIGFNMIVYIAGLQTLPKELYEAADMDGANVWVN